MIQKTGARFKPRRNQARPVAKRTFPLFIEIFPKPPSKGPRSPAFSTIALTTARNNC
jgi:hypothetical protein